MQTARPVHESFSIHDRCTSRAPPFNSPIARASPPRRMNHSSQSRGTFPLVAAMNMRSPHVQTKQGQRTPNTKRRERESVRRSS